MECLTDCLKEGVRKKDFPGAAYAVVYKNGKVDKDYVGYRQTVPKKITLNGNEIYDCASLTKVVSTTTMMMKLIETKRLSLEKSISDVLPDFRHDDVKIKHILTHTSGLPADIPRARRLSNRDDVATRIYDMDLIHPPGQSVIYSDVGFILLGWVIESVTGKRLDTFARETIFTPLKMKDTSYHPDKERAAPTEIRDDKVHQGLLKGDVHDEKAYALGGEAGHAGMFSTVDDLSRFILSFLNNDEKVLKKETVDMLFPVRIDDTSNQDVRHVRSYGWQKPTKGGTAGDKVDFESTILHTGFTGCNLFIDRKHEIGFVLLSNAVHPKRKNNKIGHYRHKLANMIMAKKENME